MPVNNLPPPNSLTHNNRLRLLLLVLIALLSVAAWAAWQARTPTYGQSLATSSISPTNTPGSTTTSLPSLTHNASTQAPTPSATAALVTSQNETWNDAFGVLQNSLAVLALHENGYSQLFAYQLGASPFIRLSHGAWDDIQPALNPGGTQVAFASNRSGWWDLYLLDLQTGALTQITDSPEYDGAPSWSPDGRWLAYESYLGENGGLDIFIRPLDGAQEPIQLTDDPGADFDPSWSALGRQIAFVSTRSGENDIWVADLDKADQRFTNISRNNRQIETHPSWSPDGSQLVWSAIGQNGLHELYVWSPGNSTRFNTRPLMVGSGNWPVWSPAGNALLTQLSTPNQEFITGYGLPENTITLPPIPLDGAVDGLTWGTLAPGLNLATTFASTNQIMVEPAWRPALTPMADIPAGRQRLVALEDVQAPNAVLQDLVDESFVGLRARVAQDTGWDLLANLENAFVPLTVPLNPGSGEDWLHTGRAFAFNPLPANAGWLVILREDYGAQTYWRVLMRARYQDGSQGRPIKALAWNFNARSSGDPRAYETGGAYSSGIPAGYWVDFTHLASAYGWERIAALSTWRSAYQAARFHQFIHSDGLDWQEAMLEIYPPEVLVTPTAIIPTTQVPTRTPRPSLTPIPTRTRWPTRTSTPTATLRPASSATPTP